jgi:hypothetical protein
MNNEMTTAAVLTALGLATPAFATDSVSSSQDRIQPAQADGFRSNRTVIIRRGADRRPGFGRSDFGRLGFGRRGGGNKTLSLNAAVTGALAQPRSSDADVKQWPRGVAALFLSRILWE